MTEFNAESVSFHTADSAVEPAACCSLSMRPVPVVTACIVNCSPAAMMLRWWRPRVFRRRPGSESRPIGAML